MNLFDQLISRTAESHWQLSAHELRQYIEPKVAQGLGMDEFTTLIERAAGENRPLRIKYGIDPTGSQIHIGHMVPMMLLEIFVRAGHHVDFIVGDFTGQVGDPSGRDTARAVITRDMIRENMATYIEQASTCIAIDAMQVHYNSTWLDKLTFAELLGVLQKISMSTVMQRDDFRKRMENGQPVTLAESVYGLMMGFDSVELHSDIEVGGVDQFLNFVQCREVQELYGQHHEIALCTPLIEGTDGSGRKMSKSFGNYIPVLSSHEEKFGKVMSIPDHLILPWFKAFTFIKSDELPELEAFAAENPLEAKKQLGICLIALATKSAEAGQIERERFEQKFAEKIITRDDCEQVTLAATIFDTLVLSFESKSQLRRLFEESAVRIQESDVTLTATDTVPSGTIVRVGKRRFFWVE